MVNIYIYKWVPPHKLTTSMIIVQSILGRRIWVAMTSKRVETNTSTLDNQNWASSDMSTNESEKKDLLAAGDPPQRAIWWGHIVQL